MMFFFLIFQPPLKTEKRTPNELICSNDVRRFFRKDIQIYDFTIWSFIASLYIRIRSLRMTSSTFPSFQITRYSPNPVFGASIFVTSPSFTMNIAFSVFDSSIVFVDLFMRIRSYFAFENSVSGNIPPRILPERFFLVCNTH